MVGFACGAAFALGLTLPPLLSKPEEVAHVAAAMFTISHGATVVVVLICGAFWDVTATAREAFLPIAIAALWPIVLIPTIQFERGPNWRETADLPDDAFEKMLSARVAEVRPACG